MYPNWDIIILHNWNVRVALCLEDGYEVIWRINIIIFLCRLTCVYWIPRFRASGSELVWDLGSESCLSFGMFLGATVGSSLEYLIIILFVLLLRNYSSTWEVYLVRFPLDTLCGSMIGTKEGLLVSWSLGLSLGYPLESTNTGAVLGSFFISHWNDTWHISWKSSWIPTWLYLAYQLVLVLSWNLAFPLTLQLGQLFALQFTCNYAHFLERWWDLYLEMIWECILKNS